MSFLAGIPLIGDVIKGISNTFFGSKLERDKYDAQAKSNASSQFSAEFGHGKTWFDSLVDGLNRLPRPIFAFSTIYLFYLCWTDPAAFVAGAKNLELMPQEAWWILGTIVVFFFGGRLSKDFGKYKISNDVLAKYQAPPPQPIAQEKRTTQELDDPKEKADWNKKVMTRYGKK